MFRSYEIGFLELLASVSPYIQNAHAFAAKSRLAFWVLLRLFAFLRYNTTTGWITARGVLMGTSQANVGLS
jgi:hypothetical protein